jgi:hypothetical protein
MVQAGMILAGKYQVERVLGQGGMGCVVSAIHLQLQQRVAIKFLLPEALRIHEAVERFLREARAAVRLRSEHVGRVIDVGQFDDGAPYMVMEFLEGMDLSQYLHRQGVLPIAHAVDFVMQGCEAIAEAHSIGIVHRDLKPANLFLTRGPDGSPLVKVLDFGISKASQGDASFNLTRTTAVMGSPGYMSPEQLRSAKDCDARTDVWALGVILFELTTGRTPFGGDSITELALKVAMDPTPPMNLPAATGFELVVRKCLGKDVSERFQNVAELAAALVPYGSAHAMETAMRIARVLQVSPSSLSFGQPQTMVMASGPLTPVPGVGGAPTTLQGAAGTYGPMDVPKKKSRTGVIAGVAIGVIAAGGIAIAVIASGDGNAEPKVESKPASGEPAKPPPPPPPPTTTASTQPPAVVTPDAGVAPVEHAAVTPDAAPAVAAATPDAGAAVVVDNDKPDTHHHHDKTPTTHKKKTGSGTGSASGSDDGDLSNSRF